MAEALNGKDVDTLLARYRKATDGKAWKWESLGSLDTDDLWLIKTTESTGKHLLLTAGFHGEEPAGCWGLLDFFESFAQNPVPGVALSILPVVNPTGIRAGARLNAWGERTNCGFVHQEKLEEAPSREGALLLNQIDKISFLGQDGFASLHEDVDADKFYLYTFEEDTVPSAFTKMLYCTEACFFDPMPDDYLKELNLHDSIAFCLCDGSFEDLLFHLGTPYTACTETPGMLPLDKRVEANRAIAEAFVGFFTEK